MVCVAAPPVDGTHIDRDDLGKSSNYVPPQAQLEPPQAQPETDQNQPSVNNQANTNPSSPSALPTDNHHLSDLPVPWSLPVLQPNCLDSQILGEPPIGTPPSAATITQLHRSSTPAGVLHNPQPTTVYSLNKITLQVQC